MQRQWKASQRHVSRPSSAVSVAHASPKKKIHLVVSRQKEKKIPPSLLAQQTPSTKYTTHLPRSTIFLLFFFTVFFTSSSMHTWKHMDSRSTSNPHARRQQLANARHASTRGMCSDAPSAAPRRAPHSQLQRRRLENHRETAASACESR